jgi:hypothetical protein
MMASTWHPSSTFSRHSRLTRSALTEARVKLLNRSSSDIAKRAVIRVKLKLDVASFEYISRFITLLKSKVVFDSRDDMNDLSDKTRKDHKFLRSLHTNYDVKHMGVQRALMLNVVIVSSQPQFITSMVAAFFPLV